MKPIATALRHRAGESVVLFAARLTDWGWRLHGSRKRGIPAADRGDFLTEWDDTPHGENPL